MSARFHIGTEMNSHESNHESRMSNRINTSEGRSSVEQAVPFSNLLENFLLLIHND